MGNSENEADECPYRPQNKWKLWKVGNESTKWSSNLEEVGTFKSKEDFWNLYRPLPLPSKLDPGCEYIIFKEHIRPTWEDGENKDGGRWCISDLEHLPEYWIELLNYLVEKGFGQWGKNIHGVVIQKKNNGDRICIWTTGDSEESGHNKYIKDFLNEQFKITEPNLFYETHAVTKQREKEKNKALQLD